MTITDSGDANGAALFVAGGTVAVTGCTLRPNPSYDVRLSGGAGSISGSGFESVWFENVNPTVTLSGNTVTNWGARKSRLSPNAAARLAPDNTVTAVAAARTEILAGTQSVDGTWRPSAGEVQLLGNVVVQGTDGADAVTTLTVEGSTRVFANDFALLAVGDTSPGALVVDGDSGASPGNVLFTSSQAAPSGATWAGIWFKAQARSSTLRNLTVAYAGRGGGTLAAIHVTAPATSTITVDRLTQRDNGNTTRGLNAGGGVVNVTASSFSNNAWYDLYFVTGSGSVSGSTFSSVYYSVGTLSFPLAGNTMPNWGALKSKLPPDVAARLAPDNAVTPIANALTEIWAGTMSVDGTLTTEPGAYRVLGNLLVQGTAGADAVTTLTLAAGTRLEVEPGFGVDIGATTGAPGRLEVLPGSPAAQVRVSSYTSGIGIWSGLRVQATGRVAVEDLEVLHASTALSVRGTLEKVDRLFAQRGTVGFDLNNATILATIHGLRCNTVSVCFRSYNSLPTVRDSELLGTSYGAQNASPSTTTIDARQNWWGDPSGPSVTGPGRGSGVSGGVLFDPWRSSPPDDGDGAPLDDGDGVADPCTGSATTGCDDNCPTMPNASQRDTDGDGTGDACETRPVLYVSNDPADKPDFAAIQSAVDAALVDLTLVSVAPGAGPYVGLVRIDRHLSPIVRGEVTDPPRPVIVDAPGSNAFFVYSGAPRTPVQIEELTVRGSTPIDAQADIALSGLVFDASTGFAVNLVSGSHVVRDSRFEGTGVIDGVAVRGSGTTRIERCRFENIAGSALYVTGRAVLSNSIVAGAQKGARFGTSSANLEVEFSTIVDSTQSGIDNTSGATVTVSDSIVYGNLGGDLVNVPCANVSRSNTDAACAGIAGNISAPPLLDASRHLTVGSPCVDMGLDLATFDGTPALDIDGRARLADGNEDGTFRTDCGADEYRNPVGVIDEVRNLRFESEARLTWDLVPGAAQYHLYGGDTATLSRTNFGTCLDALDSNRTDTVADLFEIPAPATGRFYLVTAENAAGQEGPLGDGSCCERPNLSPCP